MYETLEDFLASLPPKERKIFVEEYLPKMMSQQQSILRRTTLKFSTDLPEVEIRKAISESMGLPPFRPSI